VKPYADLQPSGQIARLRQLGQAALAYYDLPPAQLTPLAHQEAMIFRVDTAAGDRFTLRIYNPAYYQPGEILPPLLWLDALGRETDLIVPAPRATRDGRLWVEAAAPGVPEARPCVLARWVGGHFRNRSLNPARLAAVGAVVAALHNHAAGFRPPIGTPQVWNWARKFGTESVFAPGPYWVTMADEDRATL